MVDLSSRLGGEEGPRNTLLAVNASVVTESQIFEKLPH